MAKRERGRNASGKLRIGDDWSAISIIALSQSNPLKAVAEFVENSIDARARNITIVRGRERGQQYLRISDDGEGIPKDEEGLPNFKYVATHICDSIKRTLKENGAQGIQGEFGIGLLSFWTVGEELSLTSTDADGRVYEMRMKKGDPDYSVTRRRLLIADGGTELRIAPLLPGNRQLSGDKIQRYLASELRDRIRSSGVQIKVVDRSARRQYLVEPRQFEGRLLHRLPAVSTPSGDAYLELYLSDSGQSNRVELHRLGTRVLEDLTDLAAFQKSPWSEGSLEGLIDVPFLHLTPGTRSGIIHDQAYNDFCRGLEPVEHVLSEIIEEQKRAEEERASEHVLKTIQKAFREAMLSLPAEEYDWFDIKRASQSADGRKSQAARSGVALPGHVLEDDVVIDAGEEPAQKEFFHHAGPLHNARISPRSSVVPVNESRPLRAVSRDRSGRLVEERLTYSWTLAEGEGRLENADQEIAIFHAPAEPELTRIILEVSQDEIMCSAEALVTISDSILPKSKDKTESQSGLPNYTFRRAPGELWRSRFDTDQNLIVINNGHRDFVFASRSRALKLRYICRLFCKELVQKNFPGESPGDLLERMIELSLHAEENLK